MCAVWLLASSAFNLHESSSAWNALINVLAFAKCHANKQHHDNYRKIILRSIVLKVLIISSSRHSFMPFVIYNCSAHDFLLNTAADRANRAAIGRRRPEFQGDRRETAQTPVRPAGILVERRASGVADARFEWRI